MASTPTPNFTEILPTDLEMLKQRVHTSRKRCEDQQDKIDELKHALKAAEDELANRQRALERDIRIHDALYEMTIEDDD